MNRYTGMDRITAERSLSDMEARNYRIIHTDIIRNNYLQIRKTLPDEVRTLAVVKSDAYGHGAYEVSRTVLAAGADMLAVATAGEGTELREKGITAPILVLSAVTGYDVREAILNHLIQTVCSADMVHMCEKISAETGTECEVHLKIDSGMGRIGVRNQKELREVMNAFRECPHVKLKGVFTHFADADGDDTEYTRKQFGKFRELIRELPAGIIRHCANSAAIHRYPEMAMDMVRIGISLYGYPPVPEHPDLHPAMEWHASVSYVKTIEAGEAVSYGMIWHSERPTRIATVTCGYGDGYHRAATGNAYVLIHGKKVPVVGRICMDQFMADITEVPETIPGDDVILIGRSGNESVTAEDLARAAGTISYEVLLAATDRVKRIFD